MEQYQEFIAASRYARWLPEEGRRETWLETVARYVDFFHDKIDDDKLASELEDSIRDLEVMPSMRCLMTAGPALERDNVAGFNCSYLPIDRKSTRLNSSHTVISYAVFCLKKKKRKEKTNKYTTLKRATPITRHLQEL